MAKFNTLSGAAPKIIAHRGASGLLPEHTVAAYRRAILDGADFIEPDLVFTRDGELVARHDGYLSTTTDVAGRPEFAGRKRYAKAFKREDWFVEDFTLAEIKRLRARQPFPGRPETHDGKYQVPTFAEVLEVAKRGAKRGGRAVGVYPETKHPEHYRGLGHDFAPALVAALERAELPSARNPVVIQSFRPGILRRLKKQTKIPLIQLVSRSYPQRFILNAIARYAAGVGPDKALLVKRGRSSGYLEYAHALGLEVHPYTFRDDAVGEGFATIGEELGFYFALGVDAVFADFPKTAVTAREAFSRR